ncbi:LacI family DNA-binding transcriptional regulator [Georgenia deserti]|uniref:LacI family DNA-binding transcriptional regulator n=1 Tax=Georgenia deserti TaxID=2093781 RepID=A0ABW4L1W3_9MICO
MTSRPTIRDVAAHAGVSKSLVSLALRGDPGVRERTRERILLAAEAIGYRSNVLARSLREGRTMLIGVVISSLENPYHTEIVTSVEEAAESAGLSVLLAHGSRDRGKLTGRVESLLDLGLDGLVVVSSWVEPQVLRRAARRAPVVMVGRSERPVPGVDAVNNDDEHGAALAVQHLHATGHTRIAHVGSSYRPAGLARRHGYAAAMRRAGLGAYVRVLDAFVADEGLGTLLARALEDGYDAYFARNDVEALDLIDAADHVAARVPDDLAVVGYDDSALARRSRPRLTSVQQRRELLGRRAVDLLLSRIDGRAEDQHLIMEPRLIVRDSTRPRTDPD